MRANGDGPAWGTMAATTLGLRTSAVSGLLAMLILIDAALIVFHLSMMSLGHPQEYVFDLGADRGYGEFFQYAKNAWAILLLGLLVLSRRAGVYVAWAMVCAYFLIDDAFLLHENAGWAIRDLVPGRPGWAVHVGELAFVGGVGIVLLAVVWAAHRRASNEDREVSAVIALLFGALIFFGIAVDGIHHLVFPGPGLRTLFTVIEDGGELVVLSAVVTFVFAVALCGHRPVLPDGLARVFGVRAVAPSARKVD